jgi:hypothetical protein
LHGVLVEVLEALTDPTNHASNLIPSWDADAARMTTSLECGYAHACSQYSRREGSFEVIAGILSEGLRSSHATLPAQLSTHPVADPTSSCGTRTPCPPRRIASFHLPRERLEVAPDLR